VTILSSPLAAPIIKPAIAPRDNIYFAIRPDAPAIRRAQTCADGIEATLGRPRYRTPGECLHLTLAGLGPGWAVSREVLSRAELAAAGVRVPPFLLALNRIESWRGDPRPWVMTGEDGLIGFYGLRQALVAALAQAGLGLRWASNVTAHMTLMWDGREAPVRFIPPIRWWVREFVLIQGHVGEGRHTILGRWPLTG
jgi:2'-5' RNA ligase